MKEEAAKHLPLKCPALFLFGVHTSAMNYQRTSTDVPKAEQLAQLALCLQPLQSTISTLLTPPPEENRKGISNAFERVLTRRAVASAPFVTSHRARLPGMRRQAHTRPRRSPSACPPGPGLQGGCSEVAEDRKSVV